MDSSGILVFLAGAAGAAIIKMFDNVIQFVLARKAKREDDKQTDRETSLDDVMNEINELKKIAENQSSVVGKQGNALRVFMYDKIDYLSEKFINLGSVPYGIRKDVDILYRSYKGDLEANGDLAAQMELFFALPVTPSHLAAREATQQNE